MDISFANSAIEDLQDIKTYYLQEGVPAVGQHSVNAIIERIEALAEHPHLGRVVPEFNDTAIRELLHPPFRIVYLSTPQTLTIIRVWRSERMLKLPTE